MIINYKPAAKNFTNFEIVMMMLAVGVVLSYCTIKYMSTCLCVFMTIGRLKESRTNKIG